MGVGYDNVDIKAAGRLGIPVCNIPDYGTEEVADHALSLILGLYRGVFSSMERIQKKEKIQGTNFSLQKKAKQLCLLFNVTKCRVKVKECISTFLRCGWNSTSGRKNSSPY